MLSRARDAQHAAGGPASESAVAPDETTTNSPAAARRRRSIPRAAALGALCALIIGGPVAIALESGESASAHNTHSAESSEDSLAARSEVRASRAAERAELDAAEKAAAEKAAADKAAAKAAANKVVMPLEAGTYRQTSGYGPRAGSVHLGTDLAAPRDTPIRAAAAGTVVHAGAGKDGRSSNLVIVEHNINGETFYTWYVHMYDDGVYVTEGQQVAAGEVIGGVGSNGNSTGDHLHFEVHKADDSTVDPLAWLQQYGV